MNAKSTATLADDSQSDVNKTISGAEDMLAQAANSGERSKADAAVRERQNRCSGGIPSASSPEVRLG